jgi:hypothetical protein
MTSGREVDHLAPGCVRRDTGPERGGEVIAMTSAERVPEWPRADHPPIEELARRQGVKPIQSVDQLAVPGLFDSDEEWEEFLADLYASRRADLG